MNMINKKGYNKLKAWYNGEYEWPISEKNESIKDLSDLEATNQWALKHNYDFPIYGSTSVDLSPISDYLTILSEHGIYFKLPELVISHDHEEYEWIYSSFPGTDLWHHCYTCSRLFIGIYCVAA